MALGSVSGDVTLLDRTFFQEWTNSCRRRSPLAKPSNLPCAPQALVAGSRRWRRRVRLDEAVISSAEGARFSGLCEPLSPSAHLRTRVAPPPSRRCQSLTTGARGRWSSRLVPVSSSSLATFKEGLQGAPPARIFARKMSLLSAAQIFLPLRGANRMAPCGAGNLFDGEARAQKWLEKCAGAESTRLVALVPKIKVRCANTAGNTGAAGAGVWSRWRRRQSLTGVRPLARVRACAAAALRRSAREPPPRARPREPCASAPL